MSMFSALRRKKAALPEYQQDTNIAKNIKFIYKHKYFKPV